MSGVEKTPEMVELPFSPQGFTDTLGQLQELNVVEFFAVGEDCARFILREPLQCHICQAMHFWFVNCDGRTRCVDCHGRYIRDGARVYQAAQGGGP